MSVLLLSDMCLITNGAAASLLPQRFRVERFFVAVTRELSLAWCVGVRQSLS